VNQAAVCLGTAQEYTASVSGGVPPHAIAWDFSYDGVTFNAEGAGTPVIYTQPASGAYTVRARVTDSCDTQQIAFSNVLVTVNAVPAANPANATPNPACFGSAVQFNADPTGGAGPYAYEWDFNEDFVVDSTEKNPLHTYSSTGSYNARVKVTDSNNCNTGWIAVPNNPIVVSTAAPPCGAPPSEVSGPGAPPLVFAADRTTLSWEDASGVGVASYNLYKGDVAALSSGYGACFQPGLTNPTATDSSAPPAGEARFYLVTGEDASGLESTLGNRSDGERANASPCL
jgi:PKD repeat protein